MLIAHGRSLKNFSLCASLHMARRAQRGKLWSCTRALKTSPASTNFGTNSAEFGIARTKFDSAILPVLD